MHSTATTALLLASLLSACHAIHPDSGPPGDGAGLSSHLLTETFYALGSGSSIAIRTTTVEAYDGHVSDCTFATESRASPSSHISCHNVPHNIGPHIGPHIGPVGSHTRSCIVHTAATGAVSTGSARPSGALSSQGVAGKTLSVSVTAPTVAASASPSSGAGPPVGVAAGAVVCALAALGGAMVYLA